MQRNDTRELTAALKMRTGAIRYEKFNCRFGADGLLAPPPEIVAYGEKYVLRDIDDRQGTVFYQQE